MRCGAALSVMFLLVGGSLFTGCKKETVIETRHDSIIVRHDSIIMKYDVKKWMARKWTIEQNIVESYTGTTMTQKTIANYIGLGHYVDFKSDGTYTSFDINGNRSGSWELLADNWYVIDKNNGSLERYYLILTISEKKLTRQGPFTKTGAMYTNFLDTQYLDIP